MSKPMHVHQNMKNQWGKTSSKFKEGSLWLVSYFFSKDDVVQHMISCSSKALSGWVEAYAKDFTEQKPVRIVTEKLR
jgi:hypothetical protein